MYAVADPHRNTLVHFQFNPEYKAPRGGNGAGALRSGRAGRDLEIPMPVGTLIFRKDPQTGEPTGHLRDVAAGVVQYELVPYPSVPIPRYKEILTKEMQLENSWGITAVTTRITSDALTALNDLDADGRDVSWLWDVDFELLAEGEAPLSTSGIRGADMANRLKYAGVPSSRITPLETDLRQALDAFVASVPEGETGYVLPTYTAMLELRHRARANGALST